VLTGTPVQNNLMELYSLLDIVQNDILGHISQFRSFFANIIERGLVKNTSNYSNFEWMRAQKRILELKRLYKPHFKRRLKKEMFHIKSAELSPISLENKELPLKTDLVVWVPMSQA